MAGDGTRLDHRRVRSHARRLGLSSRGHRGRALDPRGCPLGPPGGPPPAPSPSPRVTLSPHPPGPILNALARLDPLPSIAGPSPDVSAPTPRIAHEPRVAAASHSVVRVIGSACGLAIEGSGWVAAADVVVTNAHVVAGEQDTT